MEKPNCVIIGAGVIGIAIAYELSRTNSNIIVLERHSTFGQETSSRNSEVIHAGIYYVPCSLKARLCIEGKKLLYQFCKDQHITHKQLGKLIVASNDEEVTQLHQLIEKGKVNGVDGLSLLTKDEIKKIEPNIRGTAAIYSASTGIIDTHQFMKRLESLSKDKGVIFAYNCEVVGIEKNEAGYQVDIRDADGEKTSLLSRIIINSGGLSSDRIAQMAGIDIVKAGYKLHYAKGEYFRVSSGRSKLVNRLIYPPPQETGLGIHTVPDLQGQLRLGPNAFYVDKLDYNVDPLHRTEFFESAKRLLPFLEPKDLTPDMAGIRPKLQGPDEPIKDFVISHEEKYGLHGFINLIGIESPGLTASLAIAKYVEGMI